jgi:hypothetical protein
MVESSDDGIEIDFEDEGLDSPVARAGAGGFIKLFRASGIRYRSSRLVCVVQVKPNSA